MPGTAFTFYITITLCVFATHLDIYLHETGPTADQSHSAVRRLGQRPGGGDCAAGLQSASGPLSRRTRQRRVAHRAFSCVWIALHLARMPDSLPVSDDINYSLYLPFFPFMVLLFGIGLGVADGSERALQVAAAVAFLLLSATIAVDAIMPGTFGVLNSRAAGLPMNANVAAFNLVLLLAAAVRYDTLGRRDVLLIALGLVIVALTLSRGGMLLFVAFVVGYLYLLLRASDLLRRLKSLAVLVALGAATYLCLDWIAVSLPLFDVATVPERFDQIMLRSEYVGDDDVRFAMLSFYLGLIAQQPLLGYGAGYSLSGVPGAPDDGAGPAQHVLARLGRSGLARTHRLYRAPGRDLADAAPGAARRRHDAGGTGRL